MATNGLTNPFQTVSTIKFIPALADGQAAAT